MTAAHPRPRTERVRIALEAMCERGLAPEFAASVQQRLSSPTDPGKDADPCIRDLTALPWCSLANDDSLDLDQLSVCKILGGGAVKIFVAVADVDALVKNGSTIDERARISTTSVYTSARIFSTLPERLSIDLTSLNPE